MATTVPQRIPLTIAIAPFPEGFAGNMDETFQQAVQLMDAFIEGNFLTGLILPPGSTLPTTDQGPIAMGGVWYFWDPASGKYIPQTVNVKVAKNFARNSAYQIAQLGTVFNPAAGITQTWDMVLCRVTQPGVIATSVDIGPAASPDNDAIPASIVYTVGPSVLPTPAAADLCAHEHLFEGADLGMLVGQTLSLSFSIWVNQPGIYSAYLTSYGRDVSYVFQFTITNANIWTRIKIPGIPPLPTGQGNWNFAQGVTGLYFGVPMCVGSQWRTTNTNQWVNQFAAGTAQNINLLTVANNQLKVTGIKLEASTGVTYLSVPSWDADYWDAIRFYFTSFNYQSTSAGMMVPGRVIKDGTWNFNELFSHRMCKAPTVVPYGYASHVAGFITDLVTNNDVAVASLVANPKGVSDIETAQLVTTGNTHTTTTIDGIPSTTGLGPGMGAIGLGIPVGATIATVPSGTSVTLSVAATATATGVALTFNKVLKGEALGAFITADARLS